LWFLTMHPACPLSMSFSWRQLSCRKGRSKAIR
jgi:hypothetical protein